MFHCEDVAATMDRSRLKNGWRALLGPFVEFDSNYRLLLKSDLEWWRMERERHGSEWLGLPMAVAINQLPPPAQKKPARAKSAATAAAAAQRALKAKATKGPPAVLELMRQLSNTAVKKARATNDKAKFEFEFEGESATGAIEGVLNILRHEFKTADAVGNLIHLLESKGSRVYSLAIEAREVDAFSVWHRSQPFVFLNTFKSAEHSRFDAAHEIGHLVRDRHSMLHGSAHSPDMEREANAFASALLMPRANVLARRNGLLTLEKLMQYKHTWGVSLAALAYRMNHLGLFSEWAYRNLCIQIAKNGYRTSEPSPMRPELSQLLRKVFDALRAEGITRGIIAKELCVMQEDIDNLTFGLTLSNVTFAPSVSAAHINNRRFLI